MKASKSSLADLRRLRAEAVPPEPPAAPRRAKPGSRRGGRGAAARPRGGEHGAPAARPDDEPETPGHPAQAEAPPLDPADRALFRQAMRFVRPLPDHGPRARAGGARRDPESLLQARRQHAQGGAESRTVPPAHRQRRKAPAFDPEAGAFLQAGCGPDLLRGLRRGKWIPQASLDLHGSTLEQARERLDRFLASCLEHDVRCVRVIHGKGIGSRQGEPVLKDAIRQHLCRLEAVQAWVQCGEHEGGEGALHALLRLESPR